MWSYSGNPLDSQLDEIRFKIGDTDKDYPLLSDEEIQYTLAVCEENVLKAAVKCCEAILAKWAKEVTYKTESEQVALSDRAKAVRGIIADLEEELKKQTMHFPKIRKATPTFTLGMNDNAR